MADTTQNILINIDLETGQVNSELDKLDSKLGGLGQNTNPQPFKSIRQEILAAREEAVRLAIAIEDAEAAGQNVDKLSERYNQVTQRAAQLNDAVGDVNASIANANPDNRLQGLVSIAQGAITAVQGVAGAFALIGVDAETAQVAVAKLQGLIALTDAIGSIDKITKGYKDLKSFINASTIATAANSIAQKANNAATAAAAVVQSAFTGSVVASSLAFKALRLAIIGTGIGALVIGLGFVIEKIMQLTSATDDAAKSSENFSKKLKELSDKRLKQIDNDTKVRIAKLKAQGASELAVEQETLNGLLAKRTQYANDIKLKELEIRGTRDKDRKVAYEKELKDLQDLNDDLKTEIELTEINITQIKNENNKKKQDDAKKSNDRLLDIEKKNNEEVKLFLKEAQEEEERRRKTAIDAEIFDITNTYKKIIDKTKQNSAERIELERLRDAEIAQARAINAAKTIRETNQLEVDVVQRRLSFFKENLQKTVKEALSGKDNALAISNLLDSIKNIYDLSFEVRKKQIELERDANIEALKNVDAATRASRKKLYEDDAKARIAALKVEIDTELKSTTNTIDIFNFEKFDTDKLNSALNKIGEIIDKIEFRTKISKLALEIRDGLTFIAAQTEQDARATAQKNYDARQKEILDNFRKQRDLNQQELQKATKDFDLYIVNQQFLSDIASEEQIKAAKQYSQEILKINEETIASQSKINKQFIESFISQYQILGSTIAGQGSFIRNFLSLGSNRKAFDETLKLTSEFYDAQVAEENARFEIEKQRRIKNNEEVESLEREHKQRLIFIDKNYKENIDNINNAVFTSKLDLVNQIGNVLGNLGQLYETGTKEAKGLAIAEIAINTATGFVNGLYLAQKTAEAAPPPAVPFVFAAFYASQIASVLAAAAKARQVLAQVPGGASTSGNSAPPSIPSAINASLFNLPPEAQAVRVVGQPSQVVRAYITNEDLRSAQEKQAFLNKLSSF